MVWRAEVLSRSQSGAESGGTYNPNADTRNGARQREHTGACLVGVRHRNRINDKSFYARHAPIALRADDGNDNAHLSVSE